MAQIASIIPVLTQGIAVAGAVQKGIETVDNLFGDSAEEKYRKELRASQDLALRQLQAQQNLDISNREQNAALEREKLALDSAAAEESRRAALKRAVARQRSIFGGSGIGSSDGSSQAVLLGLFDESEEEKSQREKLDQLKLGAIESDLDQQRRLNVLQRTQLQEKQNLSRLFA